MEIISHLLGLAALLVLLGLTERDWIYNPFSTIVAWLHCLMDYRGLTARGIKQARHVNNTRPTSQSRAFSRLRHRLDCSQPSFPPKRQHGRESKTLILHHHFESALLAFNWSRSWFHTSPFAQTPVSYVWPPNTVPETPGSGWRHRLGWSGLLVHTSRQRIVLAAPLTPPPNNWHYITAPDSG